MRNVKSIGEEVREISFRRAIGENTSINMTAEDHGVSIKKITWMLAVLATNAYLLQIANL